MDELLKQLLDELDKIAESNEEIFDTDCREKMAESIFRAFINPEPDYETPTGFGLYANEADMKVGEALRQYIQAAREESKKRGSNHFHDRLRAFQNKNVRSDSGNFFDDYFGWVNPADFDLNGNVIRKD